MSDFDLAKFRNTDFKRRTQEVPVPELAHFYPKDKKDKKGKKAPVPVWLCQNMTGDELYRMREAVERNKDIDKTLSALAAGQGAEVAKEALGVTKNVSDDLARRLEVLVAGTVDEDFSKPDAVSLAKEFPLVFDKLTNAIMLLSGQGAKPGGKNGSGTTPK